MHKLTKAKAFSNNFESEKSVRISHCKKLNEIRKVVWFFFHFHIILDSVHFL